MATELQINTARVLIIEESIVLRQLSLNLVEELGLIGQTVCKFEQAFKCINEKHFDLVLVEVRAPEKKAVARVDALRRLARSRSRKLPIVAMSSGIKRAPLIKAGADDILMRPFMIGELEAVVDRWLSPGVIL